MFVVSVWVPDLVAKNAPVEDDGEEENTGQLISNFDFLITITMHWIQKHILRELTLHQSQRFGQLRPKQVESNLFIYHLKSLMREGYVSKSESGEYSLAPAGKAYVDRISMEKFQPRIQPKIVTLLMVRNSKGELLLWKRDKQPFLGKIGFITGKIHLGEKLAEAAHRELQEKAGLTAKLGHRGDGYLTIYEGNQLISQVLFHCFVGKVDSDTIPAEFAKKIFWGKLSDYPGKLIPGTEEIYEVSEQNLEHFFVEIEEQ